MTTMIRSWLSFATSRLQRSFVKSSTVQTMRDYAALENHQHQYPPTPPVTPIANGRRYAALENHQLQHPLTPTVTSTANGRRVASKNHQQHRFRQTVTSAPNGYQSVQVKRPDGSLIGDFHSPWLFFNNPNYIHPSSGQHTRSLIHCHDYSIESAQLVVSAPTQSPPPGCLHSIGTVYEVNDDKIKKHTTASEDSYVLQVEWTGPTRETAYYDLDWLERCRYDSPDDRRDETTILDRTTALSQHDFTAIFPQNDSDDKNDDALYDLYENLFRTGAVLVNNVPSINTTNDGPMAVPVERLGRALAGSLSHGSLYGNIFDVQTVQGAQNIAFTSSHLSPHQDLAYYESPPGIQFLHCVQNHARIVGGDSILVDGLAAATALREILPAEYFQSLVDIPATFVKQRPGADLVYRRSHIRTDAAGTVVSVSWSPPFEGPLLAASCGSSKAEDYFVARAAMERLLDASLPPQARLLPMLDESCERRLVEYAHEHTWEQRLEPGQMVLFNNQRMLHGRRAFHVSESALEHHEDQDGPALRHLSGCYTNIDETLNRYRLLRRSRLTSSGTSHTKLALVGNGSSWCV